jgi:AcrR family transcriptional regulator
MNVHSFIIGELNMADRAERKKQITAQRREQILKAALEIFSQKGYDAATIPEIANLAGIATGTIYIYYPSKRELFTSVMEGLVATPLVGIFEKASTEEFPIAAMAAMKDRVNLMESDIMARFSSLIGEIQRDPELKALYREKLLQPFLSRMEGFYRARIDAGEFRQFEPAIVIRAVGGMVIGSAILMSLEGDDSPLSQMPQEKVSDEIINFLLHGLLK